MKRVASILIVAAAIVVVVPFAAHAAVHAAVHTPRARIEDFFTPAEISRSLRFRGLAYLIGFSALALDLGMLALLGLGVGSRRLTAWSARITRSRWWLQTLVLAAVVTIVPAAVELPLAVAGWRHERAFGLATNSLPAFLVDDAKAIGFSIVAAAIVAFLFVAVARRFRRTWPVVIAAGGSVLVFVVIFVLPLIYEPAFSVFKPVDPATRARVIAIAAREGVKVDTVLISVQSVRTTAENAYVSGFGATKRVVLFDMLVRRLSPREVDLVVAHEIGHVKHNDILKGAVYGSIGVVAGAIVLWWLLGRRRLLGMIGAHDHADPAVLPFLAFFIAIATLVTLPLQNFVSRRVEASADRAAIVATNDPQGAVQLEVHLARDDISDLHPNGFIRWMFFTHPSTIERIQAALDYEAEHPAT
ncbi:MAG: M48 family metalloprotease [Actinomycetota bacterium]